MRIEDPASGQVHLWLAFDGEIVDPQLLAQYRALLTEEERLQQQRFHFEKDRKRYLITRALVRSVLSRYRTTIDPRDWQFKKNQYGRPEVANFDAREPPLWFNISHTTGLIVLGVSSSSACMGVDTEAVDRERCPLEIADRYFSSDEVSELRSLAPASQVARFFQYWTLKESYIKAQGMGLSLPLDQFSFGLARQGIITIAFHAPLQDDPQRLSFWLMRPTQNHLLAVCAQRHDQAPSSLLIRKTVPMSAAEFVQYPALRRSLDLSAADAMPLAQEALP